MKRYQNVLHGIINMVLQESSIKVRLLQLWLLSQGPQGANRALTEHELCVQNTVELNFALELAI